jgi:hypothetical protein
MAKKKEPKKETRSEFLRKELSKNPDLDYHQVNRKWIKTGHAGEISNALYYQVRAKMGIHTVWAWVKEPETGTAEVTSGPSEVYQFKITLKDTKPPIWRRIQVADCTLDQLHEHIQTAMGWTNSHLHHFRINDQLYGDPMLLAGNFEDSTATKLSDILPRGDEEFRFEYEYDFGDGWDHEVLYERRLKSKRDVQYPLCLGGERACPPEDVGGVWGYVDFLEAVADPENDQHEEMLEWAGGSFDPEAFDAVDATMRMKGGLPDWRKMR